ncbi:MAG: alanine racemase [Candidatus Aminicenantes bacterium]|nr:alanine racemase [Candidatus Aminicenantes bacterium]
MKIKRPTLIINKKRVLRNIERMANKAKKDNVRFRPHFKTHQSGEIGSWFRDSDVTAITVSSVEMALYFREQGWEDITIAFPVNKLEIEEINSLCRGSDLGLLVEAQETVSFLTKELKHKAKLWLKIDTGYHRTGIAWDAAGAAADLIKAIEKTPLLDFAGLLTHSGHAYDAQSTANIKEIYNSTVSKMNTLRDRLKEKGFDGMEISIGDTPTCSTADSFKGVDEIRCGNFVFYDVIQLFLGACKEEDIAAAAACPVVAKHARRNELVIYGGAVHLSKDYVVNRAGQKIYGLVALPRGSSWGPSLKDTFVSSLSQEHGVIKTAPGFSSEGSRSIVERVEIGDILMILPAHSCLTANLLRPFFKISPTRVGGR